jgi:hypothetical protein
MDTTHIAIGNIYEYNSQYERVLYPAVKTETVQVSTATFASADMAVFWGGDKRFVFTPHKIDVEFLKDICELLNYNNVENLYVPGSQGLISKDIINNESIYSRITSDKSRPIRITSWGITDELYELITFLESQGVSIYTDEVPSKSDHWAVKYFDSKTGARDLLRSASSEYNIDIIPGFVCYDKLSAFGIAESLWSKGKGCVIKSNFGAGGKGITIIPPHYMFDQMIQGFSSGMLDEYRAPFVVEEYVSNSDGSTSEAPTFNGYVKSDGTILTMGLGIQLIKERQFYAGGYIGKNILSANHYNRINQFGISIGKLIYEYGYRGWFNIDFILIKDTDSIFACEINTRRSGSSTAIDIANRIWGDNWNEKGVIFSYEKLPINPRRKNYTTIREWLLQFSQSLKNQNAGIIPTIVTSMPIKHTMGIVIYATTIVEVKEIAREIEKVLIN